MISRITLTALFLAAAILCAAGLAAPRAASAAPDPGCQTLISNLKAATLASGRLDQAKLNEAVACLQSASTTTASGSQTGSPQAFVGQPANGVAIIGSISGILYPISLSPVSPIEFCDNLYADFSVPPAGGWYGFFNIIGAYTNGLGLSRGGYWIGSFAFVAQGMQLSPTSFVHFAGFGTLSLGACEQQQEG